MRRESGWRTGGATVLVLLLGAVLIALATHRGQYQWDLQTYYYRDLLSAIAGTPAAGHAGSLLSSLSFPRSRSSTRFSR